MQEKFEVLRKQGIQDLSDYLVKNPHEIIGMVQLMDTIDMNKEYLKLFGAESKVQMIDSILQTVIPQTIPSIINGLTAIFNNTLPFEAEFIYQNLSGQQIHTRTRGLLVSDPDFDRAIGSIVDITQFKHDQEKLGLLNQRLIESNTALENFVHVAQHDLKEPLRKMSNFSKLLETSMQDHLTDDQQKYIDIIKSGSNRLQRMIDGLVQISQINVKIPKMEEVDVNVVVKDILTLELSALIQDSGAKITIEDTLPAVYGNSALLHQLFQNLLGNGIKFVESSVVPEIKISSRKSSDGYVFAIQDNGIGIDKRDQKHIFNIFTQLNPQSRYPGSGIGLAICKAIMVSHGGKIALDSELSKGSVIELFFPKRSTAT